MTSRGLEEVDTDECYILIRGRSLGRVGVKLAEELAILPVYYAVLDRDIVFRTDPGTKLTAAVLNERVAFEVDNAVPAWSVLLSGYAHEIRESAEQATARARLGIDWPAGSANTWCGSPLTESPVGGCLRRTDRPIANWTQDVGTVCHTSRRPGGSTALTSSPSSSTRDRSVAITRRVSGSAHSVAMPPSASTPATSSSNV